MKRIDLLNRSKVMVSSLAVQAVIGYADYATGTDLHLDVFYFIPVAITAWQLRRFDVIISALIGALTWGCADLRGGHHYNNPAFLYWNIFVSFSALLILGLMTKALRDHLKATEAARQELATALANLRQSTAELEKLRGQLQVVCAWSKRIRVGGQWMTFEEFLKNHLQFKLTHGVSPEAMAHIDSEIEQLKQHPIPETVWPADDAPLPTRISAGNVSAAPRTPGQ